MNERHILITGCSGGGKSSLLEALNARGLATVPEPGRRIVKEEDAGNGAVLPRVNPKAFAQRAVMMSRSDLAEAAKRDGAVFFDRGLIDAAVALQHAGGKSYRALLDTEGPFAKRVLIAPPWPEIFGVDPERKHGFGEAVEEHARLLHALLDLGYQPVALPKMPVEERVVLSCGNLAVAPPQRLHRQTKTGRCGGSTRFSLV